MPIENDSWNDRMLEFISKICLDTIPKDLIYKSPPGYDTEEALRRYSAEAIAGLNLIKPHLPLIKRYNLKILEIGSGLCILAHFLKTEGFDITALEPGEGEFDFFDSLGQKVKEKCIKANLSVAPKLCITAQNLSPELHGVFDFVFSVNVLEHIPELESALEKIEAVTKQDGRGLHSCPNYNILYEPHFGIPLIPFFPKLTRRIFNKKISIDEPLWNSINFVTPNRLKKFCKKNQLKIHFKPGVMADAFDRFNNDPIFRSRHGSGLLTNLINICQFFNINKILTLLPGDMNTPMVFEIKKN